MCKVKKGGGDININIINSGNQYGAEGMQGPGGQFGGPGGCQRAQRMRALGTLMKLASVLNGGQNGFPGGGGCGQCMGAHNPLFGGHQHGGGGLNFGISGGFRMTAGNFLGGLV